jgi:N-methylhydantoinase A
MTYRVGIDIGGTFTDFALLSCASGRIATHKRLTTSVSPAIGVLQGLTELLEQENVSSSALEGVVHGTTLITNAVIERKGARLGMLTTSGFKDVPEMREEHRYDMFDLRINFPEPLVKRAHRVEIDERVYYDGKVGRALELSTIQEAVRFLVEEHDIESIAVCFMHAYANPDHERRTKQTIAAVHPDLFVSLSSDVFPDIREFSRWTTTCINAYTQPVIDRYLDQLEKGLEDLGIDAPLFIMTSSGGTVSPAIARMFPVRILESGPAAGVLMSSVHGKRLSRSELLSFDMGGTTAKGALISAGKVSKRYDIEIGRVHDFKAGSGFVAKIPAIDMIEIGFGGGSIAAVDSRGLLSVGPQSAGAAPGPACYDLGGQAATLTDANLVLGYLAAESFLGGRFSLNEAAARSALKTQISEVLNLSLARTAFGIHEVVNEGIARAFRIHASERGFDYRGCAMVAFGGSGPIHAIAVARKLRVPQVIYPVGAGVMSAFGLLASPLVFEALQGKQVFLNALSESMLSETFSALKSEASQLLIESGIPPAQIRYQLRLDMRYAGQGHTIEVQLPTHSSDRDNLSALETLFKQHYATLYAHIELDSPIEITTFKVGALGPEPSFPSDYQCKVIEATERHTTRPVFFQAYNDYIECPVRQRVALRAGETLKGPLIVEETESTVVIDPGTQLVVDPSFNLIGEVDLV